MHASVSARPKPSPQNSLAMPIPNSALCFVLYFTVNDRNDFYLIAALGFCLEERALLFNGKTVFIGISEQIIRLGMC